MLASVLSLTLAFGAMPASAIADEVAHVQTHAVPVIELRLNDRVDKDEKPVWTSFESVEAAQKASEKSAQDDAQPGDAETDNAAVELVQRIELRIAGMPQTELEAAADDSIQLSTLATQDADCDWAVRLADDPGTFVDLRIQLCEQLATVNDVQYRVHAGDKWLEWVSNGAPAAGENKLPIDDVQVVLVQKGVQEPAQDAAGDVAEERGEDVAATEEPHATPDVVKTNQSAADKTNAPITLEAEASVPTITYQVHAQTYGWMDKVANGSTAGTTGEAKRLEAIRMVLPVGVDGGVSYRVHVQSYGWMEEASNGSTAGTTGEAKRLEAVQIRLTGNVSESYDVWYRVHAQTFGWLNWVKNGESSGTEGLARRLEAIQVVLVAKGGVAPTNDSGRGVGFITKPSVRYRSHVQTYGWQSWVENGATAGTQGESKRVEALQVEVPTPNMSGEVQVRAHVQSYGWQDWVGQGSVAGTTGESKRVEAVQIRLTDELSTTCDVWYRVHVQTYGWLGWTKNGGSAGTQELSRRLEAIQVVLVRKGASAPGSTDQPFIDGTNIFKAGYQNPAGYYQVSSKTVTITSAAQWPWNYVTPSRIGKWATRDDCVNAFLQRAREYIGAPYVWDYACAPDVGVDCIGLVYQCAYATGMDMGGGTSDEDFNPWAHYITGSSGWHSHDANNFWNYGKALHVPVGSRKPGDLVSWAGHVAIYLGNDQIIEAYTPSTGVIYNDLWAHGTPRGCIRLYQ